MDPTTRAILAAMLTGEQPERCAKCGVRYETTLVWRHADGATVLRCDACAKINLEEYPGKVSAEPFGQPSADKARLFNAFLDDASGTTPEPSAWAVGGSEWAGLGVRR